MRVLVVTVWYPTRRAPAAGIFVRRDVQALARRHDVRVLHLAPTTDAAIEPAEAVDDRVTITRVGLDPRRLDLYPRAHLTASRLMAEWTPHVVHTVAFPTLLPLAIWRPGTPWVHTEHWSGISRPDMAGWRWRAVRPVQRVLARPDVVTAVSEFLAEAVRRVRRRPTFVVPCIVEVPDSVPPREPNGRQLRLVAVGSLVPGKDPATALATLHELVARGVDARLTWVGDGPLRSSVAQLAGELDLRDRLHVTGWLDTLGLQDQLAKADLFLLPTRGETFCVAAAEALGHGRPVILGARGGQREYVDDEVGRLVSVQSPTAYADAVQEAWTALRATAPEAIARRVRERFSPDAVTAGYEQAYEWATEQVRHRRAGRHPRAPLL